MSPRWKATVPAIITCAGCGNSREVQVASISRQKEFTLHRLCPVCAEAKRKETRKRTRILVEVTCPECEQTRIVKQWEGSSKRKRSLCFPCSKIRANNPEFRLPWGAPCGRTIGPGRHMQIAERCTPVADECAHYFACLDHTARAGWPGWRIQKPC